MIKTIFFFPDNLAPYQIVRLNELYKIENNFEVYLLETKQHHRPWSKNNEECLFNLNKISSKTILDDIIYNINRCADIENVVVYGYISIMRKVVKKTCNYKSIYMFVDNHEPQVFNLFKELYKRYFLNRYVNKIIVPGLKQYQYCQYRLKFLKSIVTVPLVSDSEKFKVTKNNFKAEYFLAISRFSPEKNLSTLIKAFEIYKQKNGNKKLKIVGDGPDINNIKNLVGGSKFAHAITIEPWADKKKLVLLYQNAFAFILPSKFEPWGVVLNEALSASLPIISSTKCGANLEVSRDGVNALHFDPLDIMALSEYMYKLEKNEKFYTYLHLGAVQLSELYTPKRAAFMLSEFL